MLVLLDRNEDHLNFRMFLECQENAIIRCPSFIKAQL